jgi:predicted small lipoprotein YifL
MRAVMRVAIALALLTALAGCGQKGALYRDHQSASAQALATPENTVPANGETHRGHKAGE